MDGIASPWAPLAPSTRRVALELLRHGPLARSELALRLGLSAASLTRLTKPLLGAGMLRESPDVLPTSGGRPLQPLDVDAGRQRFVGIKLTRDRAYGVLTDLRADILARRSVAIGEASPDRVVERLVSLIAELTPGAGPAAVGVGLGGAVRGFTHVRRAPFLGWREVALGRLVADATGYPSVISNDLEALTEAEHWFGDGRGVRNFAVLTVGAGVGGGLVVHDRLVAGPDAGLGLLGHFPLDPSGPACPEGHHGCADALLTTHGIRLQASLALGRTVSYEEALDLAEAGEPVAGRIVGIAARALGALVAAVANIAQPERILVTGEGVRLARAGEERVRDAVAGARVPGASPVDLRILDDDPTLWARGAASVAIQRVVLADLPPDAGAPASP
ncbi:ROK family transcriptional regulator [Streptomyces sp. NBC_01803]|uniref:ROK family transcriptional regulator n=1 Tax=Streptomyces sp. NBC_01803 TaxID=2975946 RepID=UPI002DDC3754|nr:ROK family transcriptional regulator [Streptomyces sp. NBC_01803]WSA42801.1 ROK family transcriptional regulator [Streptomyces sp. NBC_01803]